MARPHRALLVAILVLALGTVPAAVATAQTPAGTPSATATASPATPPAAGGLSPAAIVVGLVLIGGTLLLRTRMGRADR